MSEFPPAASSQKVNSPSFAAALLRAQKVITKIESKRPLEDGQEPIAKKLAAIDGSGEYPLPPGGSSMGGSVGVGVGTGGRAPGAPGSGGGSQQQLTPDQTVTESMRVPDKMVGLIIGRSGEQISRIQAESGCKIQMAPDSGGQTERVCTLTGSRENVNRAREMVNGIVNQRGRDGRPADSGPPQQRMGGPGGGNGGQNHEEIMIPGPKVGLIIGKGGETIKQLQEKSGAKMVIIQDGPNPEFEKPLRITGDPQKIEYAKQLVHNLIKEKEMQFSGSRGGGPGAAAGNNQMWGGGHEEFSQGDASDGHERRDQDDNRARGPPRNGGGGDGSASYGSWSGGPQDSNKVEVSFTVSNLKCGIIIGRGGEVIKQINAQSGAHCELDRRSQNNRANRVFYIRGERENVEAAKRIISEKVNMPLNFEDNVSQNNSDGGGGSGSGSGDYSGGYGGQGAPTPGGAVAGGGAGGTMWPYSPQWHPSQQQPEPQQHQTQSVPINPSTGQPDFSQQWIDYYNAVGLPLEAEKIQQKANKAASVGSQQPAAQHSQAAVPSTNGSGGGGAGVPGVASAGGGAGQPDYSAQWADYYRSIGKLKEAEQIELSMKQKSVSVGATPAGPTNSAVGSYGGNASYQPQSYQQQHYQGYGGYGGYPSHQAHPAPPDQQQ